MYLRPVRTESTPKPTGSGEPEAHGVGVIRESARPREWVSARERREGENIAREGERNLSHLRAKWPRT